MKKLICCPLSFPLTKDVNIWSDVAQWWPFTHTQTLTDTHTFFLSVRITAAAGGIGRHGFHVVLILLVVTRWLQAEVVAVVRRKQPHWDIGGLPGVVRSQDVWENKEERRRWICGFTNQLPTGCPVFMSDIDNPTDSFIIQSINTT